MESTQITQLFIKASKIYSYFAMRIRPAAPIIFYPFSQGGRTCSWMFKKELSLNLTSRPDKNEVLIEANPPCGAISSNNFPNHLCTKS
jgi:hypothetical protein